MKILALDAAGQTGWAVWSPSMEAPRWGVAKLPKGSPGQTFAAFRDWLIGVIVSEGVEHIAIESVFVGKQSISAAPKLYGLIGVAQEVAYRRGISVAMVMVGDWRKHFIGQRNAEKGLAKDKRRAWLKAEARKECEKRGWFVRNDDEADALGILVYERARLFPAFGCEGDLFSLASLNIHPAMESIP